MITKNNFKSLILDLTDEQKSLILDGDKEYLFLEYGDYGYLKEFKITDDNDGSYIEKINSEDYDGSSCLVPLNEAQDILEN